MNEILNNWVFAVVMIPATIAFFKKEIGKILTAYNLYRLRKFDIDGNPYTEDVVQIMNGATGVWVDAVIERYVFSLSAKTRGVYLRYPDGGREKLSFSVWNGLRTRMPPLDDNGKSEFKNWWEKPAECKGPEK